MKIKKHEKIISSKLPIAVVSSLLLFGACQKGDTTALHSGVLLKNMGTPVKPGDNFNAL